MIIIIPFKTPTINHMYAHRGNMKIMKATARKIQADILAIVDQIDWRDKNFLRDKKLAVNVAVHESWYTGAGTVRKKDIANREKFLIDSIFKALAIDDSNIWAMGFFKIDSEEEKSIVTITEY